MMSQTEGLLSTLLYEDASFDHVKHFDAIYIVIMGHNTNDLRILKGILDELRPVVLGCTIQIKNGQKFSACVLATSSVTQETREADVIQYKKQRFSPATRYQLLLFMDAPMSAKILSDQTTSIRETLEDQHKTLGDFILVDFGGARATHANLFRAEIFQIYSLVNIRDGPLFQSSPRLGIDPVE